MYIINPNEFLVPSFGMTPFTSKHVAINHQLSEDVSSIDFLNKKFYNKSWIFTRDGKEAIAIALKHYNLKSEDVVTILTTSQNFYISSCVTKEIDKICKWNREILPETKLLFVNHEFGYPYPQMDKLVALGLPIIEDCCTTFFSQDREEKVGKYGDFAVYSIPKFFPIQIGGILVSNKSDSTLKSMLSTEQRQHIVNVMSHSLKNVDEMLRKRKSNFEYATKLYANTGFNLRFENDDAIIPYAMLLKNNAIIKNLAAFKEYLKRNGIQSSVFYGEDGFFIPNHQSLDESEIHYIYEVICSFINTDANE
jgi:rRNA-processing protein FCF1